jgi:uncharacterized protein (DUF1330 family)
VPAYVIVNVDTRDPEKYEEYKTMAQAAVAAFGGRYLARGGRLHVLEGRWEPDARRRAGVRFVRRRAALVGVRAIRACQGASSKLEYDRDDFDRRL